MELHCRIHRGLRPDLLDRLQGLEPDETIQTASLCLTASGSRQVVAARDLARVFGSIVHRLAESRPVRLLFPRDVRTIKRKLHQLGVETKEGRKSVWVEVTYPHLPLLAEVLEAGAFTAFYASVGGEEAVRSLQTIRWSEATLLLRKLGDHYFVAVFALYDESVELLSKFVPAEFVINAVREVGAEAGIKVFC